MDEMASFIAERGITRLVHFTPLMNLISMVRLQRILPRKDLKAYALANRDQALLDYIRWNDQKRLDHRLDCINLSIQRINSALLKNFRREYPQGEPWTILSIDPAYLQKEGVVFTIGNAASKYVQNHGMASGVEGLRALYGDPVTVGNSYGTRTIRRLSGMNDAYPTCVQAEVLYPGEIPFSAVKELIFETEEQKSIVKAALMISSSGKELPTLSVNPADFQVQQ